MEFLPENPEPLRLATIAEMARDDPDFEKVEELAGRFLTLSEPSHSHHAAMTAVKNAAKEIQSGDEGETVTSIVQSLSEMGFGKVAAKFQMDIEAQRLTWLKLMQDEWGEKAASLQYRIDGEYPGWDLQIKGNLAERPVSSLRILEGIPLTKLAVRFENNLSSLEPLRNMKSLRVCVLQELPLLRDLEPLSQLPLREIEIHGFAMASQK